MQPPKEDPDKTKRKKQDPKRDRKEPPAPGDPGVPLLA